MSSSPPVPPFICTSPADLIPGLSLCQLSRCAPAAPVRPPLRTRDTPRSLGVPRVSAGCTPGVRWVCPGVRWCAGPQLRPVFVFCGTAARFGPTVTASFRSPRPVAFFISTVVLRGEFSKHLCRCARLFSVRTYGDVDRRNRLAHSLP